MRQTPVDDYLEEISTELPEELYGNLSDAIYETVCEFDEEVAQLKADNAKLRELVRDMMQAWWACDNEVCPRHDERCEKGKYCAFDECAQELGIEVDE